MQCPSERDGVEVLHPTLRAAFLLKRGQRRDYTLELGDARFEVGPTRLLGRLGKGRRVPIELCCGHDD